jgi:hypothetical protein
VKPDWCYQFAAVKDASGLVFLSRAFFDRAISTLGDGEEVIVTVAKKQDKRSLAQNRAIWGPIYDQLIEGLADDVGYDRHDRDGKDKLHEGLCLQYAGTVKDPITGLDVRKFHTSKATKSEMADYIEWVARFAAERGVVVTLPREF